MSTCCFRHIAGASVRQIARETKPDVPIVHQRHSQNQRHQSGQLPVETHVREFWKLMKPADQVKQTEAETTEGEDS